MKQQHDSAHAFGRALYRALGGNGIAFCDDAYGYGCYHGFFTSVAIDKNLQSLRMLSATCSNRPYKEEVECLHGVGHGMLNTLGHNNIIKALDTCAQISPGPKSAACATGVFMEYNFRTMDDTPSGTSTRPFDPKIPNAPCDTIPDTYIPYCYQFQANWWIAVFQKEYQKVDMLCSEITYPGGQLWCYRGMGYAIAASNNYDMPSTLRECAIMTSPLHRSYCLSGAASGFAKIPAVRTTYLSLCDAAPEKYINTCISNIQL